MPYVTLPSQVIADVWAWSRDKRIKNQYTSHGAEDNSDLQAWSRLCEKAFAHFVGLSFDTVKLGSTDDADVCIGARRVDIKSCVMPYRLLCWPATKTGKYETSSFTDLALVKYEYVPTVRFKIQGWISKVRFRMEKFIWPAGPAAKKNLDPGTWYVSEEQLDDMSTFPVQRNPVIYRCQKCGDIAHHGFGVNIRAGQDGQWFCKQHKPNGEINVG